MWNYDIKVEQNWKYMLCKRKNHINNCEENNSGKNGDKTFCLFVVGLCFGKNGFILAIIIMYVWIVLFVCVMKVLQWRWIWFCVKDKVWINKLLIEHFTVITVEDEHLHWSLEDSPAKKFNCTIFLFLASFIIMVAINNFIWKFTHFFVVGIFCIQINYCILDWRMWKNVKECDRIRGTRASNICIFILFYIWIH